jgi:hypothetical protein
MYPHLVAWEGVGENTSEHLNNKYTHCLAALAARCYKFSIATLAIGVGVEFTMQAYV